MLSFLERFFRLREHGATVRGELLGGATTFATMAYIIVVNPAILEAAGLPIGPSTVATILVAVIGTTLMGLYANRPLAVAPYMGENAFLAYSAALAGIGWQLRLGTVFIAGIVFVVITLLHLRKWLADSISPSLKHSFAAGIGIFMAFIGLVQTEIIVRGPPGGPPVALGSLGEKRVLLAVLGVIIIGVLMVRQIRGAVLLGIVFVAVLGYLLGVGVSPPGIVALPFTGDYDLGPIALQLDILGALKPDFFPVLLTLVLMSFLDTLGTLVGVGSAGDMLDKDGNFPEMEKPMLVDAVACIVAPVIGSSTSGAFIESAAGVRDGARTGLAALATAALFAVSLFFIPLVQPLQKLTYAYGPALIVVGAMMFGSVRHIAFDDLTEVLPAFLTLVMIAFSYNIADGLTAGLIVHPIFKAAAGKFRDVKPAGLVLAAACLLYYVKGVTH